MTIQSKSNWEKAAEVLNKGGVVLLPADSSFGIAAVASNNEAVEKLYSIKNREANKPSLLIVCSHQQAKSLIEWTDLAEELACKYWPGGLTMVGKAVNRHLSPLIYGEGETLAVRLPSKKPLAELARKVGPFILPSANLAGEPPAFKLDQIDKDLLLKADYLVAEEPDGNPVSTLVDVRGEVPVVLRQGSVEIDL